MILVPLLNPKFATVLAENSCELRVRGTRVKFQLSELTVQDAAGSGSGIGTEKS